MSKKGQIVALGACVAALLLPAPLAVGAGALVPVGAEVIATVGSVGAGSSARSSMRCPAATPHAIGGQFNSLGPSSQDQLALSGSYPSGRRSWALEITDLGSTAQDYRAEIVCVGARGARFAYPQASGVIAPGRTGGAIATCPRRADTPLGGFFELRGAPAKDAVVSWIDVLFRHGRLTGRATAGLRSLTGAPVRSIAGVVCSSLPIAVRQRVGTVPAGALSGVTITCPQGGFAVGGTFSDSDSGDPGDITLAASEFQSARRYTVRVRSLAALSQRYVAGVVCVPNYVPSG